MKAIRLASRAQPSNPPPFLPVPRCTKELKADGQDFIGLGAAAPDFDTPDHIKEAAITAIRSGFSKLSMNSGEVATSTIRRTN